MTVSSTANRTARSIVPVGLIPMIVRPSGSDCRRLTPSAELPVADPTRAGTIDACALAASPVIASRRKSR